VTNVRKMNINLFRTYYVSVLIYLNKCLWFFFLLCTLYNGYLFFQSKIELYYKSYYRNNRKFSFCWNADFLLINRLWTQSVENNMSQICTNYEQGNIFVIFFWQFIFIHVIIVYRNLNNKKCCVVNVFECTASLNKAL